MEVKVVFVSRVYFIMPKLINVLQIVQLDYTETKIPKNAKIAIKIAEPVQDPPIKTAQAAFLIKS
jgi:hypothetical protein